MCLEASRSKVAKAIAFFAQVSTLMTAQGSCPPQHFVHLPSWKCTVVCERSMSQHNLQRLEQRTVHNQSIDQSINHASLPQAAARRRLEVSARHQFINLG